MPRIEQQVRLPFSSALEVVLQGIRIRFGRSLVTITGVVLGIAFLMSILTTTVIRAGVSAESELRNELDRMVRFLAADAGLLRDSTITLVPVGELSTKEQRFVQRMQREGVAETYWLGEPDTALPGTLPTTPTTLSDPGKAVVVIGQPPRDGQIELPDVMDRPIPVAVTRLTLADALPAGTGVDGRVVQLERELRADEVERLKQEAIRGEVRNIWIITISLLVTVIGIANAMLMSVTERFREIGTMKCLGALSSFIRSIFLVESSIMGLVGSAIGGLIGLIFAVLSYSLTYGFGLVFSSLDAVWLLVYFLVSIVAGVILSILAAIYPASYASRMLPATALRSNI